MTLLQKLNKRKKELRDDEKNKELKKQLKGVKISPEYNDMWKQFCIVGDHRIAEIDNIISILMDEGIIPKPKKKRV